MIPSMTEEIRDIVRLTQRRIVIRTLLTVMLAFACVGVVAWRSRAMGWSQPASTAMVALAALALIAWQGWRSKREWLRTDDTMMTLDTTLGLHARLVTAAEFAKQSTPPALYPTLLEETARAMPDVRRHVPKVVDHRSGLLLTALFLLLLWPQRGIWPPPLAPHIPGLTPPTPPTPPETPPSSQPQSGDQQQRGDQSSGSQGQQQESSSQGASDRNQDHTSTGSDQSQQGSGSRHSRQQSPSSRQTPQDQSSSSKQNNATPQQQAQQQQQAQSRGASEQQQGASARNEPSRQGAQAGQQRVNEQQQNAQGTGQGTAQGMKPHASADRRDGSKGNGPGQTPGQELTKVQIQQLLKELSGELKTLQEQLQAQQQMPQPAAGTSTDPNLYDRAEALGPGKGKSVPIQLEVDEQASSKARRGGGVGQPSGQIASDGPQQQPEDAMLAERGADETGVNRQRIPPEYRPVFDQLSSNTSRTN